MFGFIFFLAFFILFSDGNQQVTYDGYKVLEVSNLRDGDLDPSGQFLQALLGKEGKTQILHQNRQKAKAHLLVDREDFERISILLNGRHPYQIIEEDLGRAIQFEMNEIRATNLLRTVALDDFTTFKSLEQVESYLATLEGKYPGHVKVESIGKTHENRDIWMIRISSNLQDQSKKVIMLDAGTHAREWITPVAALHSTEKLLGDKRFWDIEWRIIPVLNPDGYFHSWNRDRLWRKNRSRHWVFHGVDLNRNYDIFFEGQPQSLFPFLQDYPGPSPFSEKESQAVRNQVTSLKGRLLIYVTIHNYGQEIVYSPGQQLAIPLLNTTKSAVLSQKMAERLKEESNVTFKHGSLIDIIYEAQGTVTDWIFFKGKVPVSLLVELRDKGSRGFLLDVEDIPDAVEDMWTMCKVLYEEAVGTGQPSNKLRLSPLEENKGIIKEDTSVKAAKIQPRINLDSSSTDESAESEEQVD